MIISCDPKAFRALANAEAERFTRTRDAWLNHFIEAPPDLRNLMRNQQWRANRGTPRRPERGWILSKSGAGCPWVSKPGPVTSRFMLGQHVHSIGVER